jgi:hypothetical protein
VPRADTLTFSIIEESPLTNVTVRIVVSVHALKGPEMTKETLQFEMKQALRSFIGTVAEGGPLRLRWPTP